MTDFDVAVIGAGPAGAATSQRLALIERSRFNALRIGESLAPAVQPLLADLGLWPQFLALGPLPSYGTRSLWGGAMPQLHSHVVTPWGCGWHVDRLAFDCMLAQAARRAGATLLCETTLVRCDKSDDGWALTVRERSENGAKDQISQLTARIVIDATGRSSRLAPWVGAERFLFDHLVSVAAQFEGIETAAEGYVMVETTADGWWYTAPVPGGRMMVMLMTDSDLCARANLGSLSVWQNRLHAIDATHGRVAGGVPVWGPRVLSAFSLRMRRCEQREPWLAVGDAALAVDPISGSGVVRALRTARDAAEAVFGLLKDRTPRAIEVYEADRDRECTAYLHERAMYYGIETRWKESPFWERRLRASAQVAGTGPADRLPSPVSQI